MILIVCEAGDPRQGVHQFRTDSLTFDEAMAELGRGAPFDVVAESETFRGQRRVGFASARVLRIDQL